MKKYKSILTKIAYAVGANFLSLGVSILTSLLVPKFFGDDIAQYGYLQIYLFYCGYLGFFHLGLCDGVFLKNGGKQYNELDKPLLSSQLRILFLFEILVSIIICLISFSFVKDEDYIFIYVMITVNLLIFLPRTLLQNYLQTTSRIKEYSSITTLGRSIYGISIIIIILSFNPNYRWFVLGDVIGKFCALCIGIWWCRDIVFCKPVKLHIAIKEAISNISIGSKLLFANIAGLLISGIVQWGIQLKWDEVVYGKISFTLNVSNLLITFISAISLVLYPTLKRTNKDKLPSIYHTLRNVLMIFLLGCLVFYYPIMKILSIWLPQYAESMRYMAILFPLCIFAAKMTLLIQTYMNVYRLEKQIMKINILGVMVAIITTIFSVFIMENLNFAMMAIVVNQIFRCVYAELVLSNYLKIDVSKDIIYEIILTIVFIYANWVIGDYIGVILYIAVYFSYLFIKRNDLMGLLKFVEINKNSEV